MSTCFVARNRYSQIASHEGAISRCEINLSWAIMGHHGSFLTTDYNIWFLDPRRRCFCCFRLGGVLLVRTEFPCTVLWSPEVLD